MKEPERKVEKGREDGDWKRGNNMTKGRGEGSGIGRAGREGENDGGEDREERKGE